MDQYELLRLVSERFRSMGLAHFITGSIASSFYGEYRSTHDIDIVADLHLSQVRDLCTAFPTPEFYLDEDSIRDAIATSFQFNIVHTTTGLKIDVIVQDRSRYDLSRFARAKDAALPDGTPIRLASPEDVILKKLLYYREGGSEKHLRDIAGILRITGKQLDRAYIEEWSKTLGVDREWELIVARESQR